MGPGYLSAYGLVAGIHVEPRPRGGDAVAYFDNGIRTHGTFDYTSLRGRFSHGCHRLQNNLAVRMFSFVVRHRRHKALGQMALDSRRSFWWQGEVFDLRLPTRGYYFELEPPLPVETLPGQIKGKLQKPVAGYVRKPGQVYTAAAAPPAPGGPKPRQGGRRLLPRGSHEAAMDRRPGPPWRCLAVVLFWCAAWAGCGDRERASPPAATVVDARPASADPERDSAAADLSPLQQPLAAEAPERDPGSARVRLKLFVHRSRRKCSGVARGWAWPGARRWSWNARAAAALSTCRAGARLPAVSHPAATATAMTR